jgi:hypothetical protein
MFAQDRELNRGWSVEGRRYRALEREIANTPGTFFFCCLLYADDIDFPAVVELGCSVATGYRSSGSATASTSERELVELLAPPAAGQAIPQPPARHRGQAEPRWLGSAKALVLGWRPPLGAHSPCGTATGRTPGQPLEQDRTTTTMRSYMTGGSGVIGR